MKVYKAMKILITGNMGYVGSIVSRHLISQHPNLELVGYDTGLFGHSLTGCDVLPESRFATQIFGDIRDISERHLDGVDSVVHLAAISNDPMGKEFERVTFDVNQHASVRLAKMACSSGVKNFVFASSCSMYGSAEDGAARRETDETHPLTAYAISKIGTETDMRGQDLGSMIFTSLRFATACGWSDRLRLDLVLNDFVACGITTGEITVLSDGSPWRPLIDVEDMGRAIDWATRRGADNGGQFLAVNAGKNQNNYQVSDLAAAVANHIPGTKVTLNRDAPPDKRSYKVDFSLFESLAPDFMPKVDLNMSIRRLYDGLNKMRFHDKDFRDSQFMRLNTLRKHMAAGRLSGDMRWM